MKHKSHKKTRGIAKPQAIAITLAIGSVCASAYAAVLVNGGVVSATGATAPAIAAQNVSILASIGSIQTAFLAQLASADAAIAAALQLEADSIGSAIKVLTKQQSVSSTLLAENAVKVAQTEASAIQATTQQERIRDTNEKFGVHGQGHKVCTVLSERTLTTDAVQGNAKAVPTMVTNTVYAAPGSYGSANNTRTAMNENHSLKYCTAEQAYQGYCAAATTSAGWDTQTSTLFTETTEDSPVYEAQNALINNMIGLPDSAPPTKLAGSPIVSNYIEMKQKKDSLISPAINSLKSIQAEFSGMALPDTAAKIAPIKAINDQVARYLGESDEYKAWNKTLVAASEHGIMKELLQVQALDLYLKSRQYRQYEREEVLLAAIVSATQHQLDKKSDASPSGSLSSDAARRAVAAREITTKFDMALNKKFDK